MARADVMQPAQRTALESYLRSLSQHPDEMGTFESMFPNRNGSLGNGLVTTERAQDRAALAAVQAWISSGTYTSIAPALQSIQQRLTGFLLDANAP